MEEFKIQDNERPRIAGNNYYEYNIKICFPCIILRWLVRKLGCCMNGVETSEVRKAGKQEKVMPKMTKALLSLAFIGVVGFQAHRTGSLLWHYIEMMLFSRFLRNG